MTMGNAAGTTPRQSFRAYVTARREGALAAGDGPALYAHPIDSALLNVLSTTGWRFYVDDLINAFIKVFLGTALRDSVWVSPTQFPDVHRLLTRCAERLGMAIPRLLLGGDAAELMAFTTGTNQDCFVYASALMVREYAPEELLFVIGHECGHIHNHHVTYGTLAQVLYGNLLGKVIRVYTWPILLATLVPLRTWSRRAEITADRAGLLCCRDIDVARKSLIKLRLGFEALARDIDIEEFLKQEKELRRESFAVRAHELFYTHPLIVKRIKALELFARSELYYDLTGLPRPDGPLLDRATLERETTEIVKVL